MNTPEEEEINEQSYEELLLGNDEKKLLEKNEVADCAKCLKEIHSDDDYYMKSVFEKKGNTGASTHTEFYHKKCWDEDEKK